MGKEDNANYKIFVNKIIFISNLLMSEVMDKEAPLSKKCFDLIDEIYFYDNLDEIVIKKTINKQNDRTSQLFILLRKLITLLNDKKINIKFIDLNIVICIDKILLVCDKIKLISDINSYRIEYKKHNKTNYKGSFKK